MYQALLTRRYLIGKVIPLLAMLSVTLCTAMVIIVFSVMSGFLALVLDAGRQMIGDVVIEGPVTGFARYDELVEAVQAHPGVAAASPVIESFGLLKMPYNQIEQVRIIGIEPESFDAVTGFHDTLYWRRLTEAEAAKAPPTDMRLGAGYDDSGEPDSRRILRRSLLDPVFESEGPIGPIGLRTHAEEWGGSVSPQKPPDEALLDRIEQAGRTLHTPGGTPGLLLGVRVSKANERIAPKFYDFVGTWFLPSREATLTVLPLTDEGGLRDPESRILPIVNEFSVERHDVDSAYVYLPFDTMQQMLRMAPVAELSETEVDEFGDPIPTGRMLPGRATKIVIRAQDPAKLRQVRRASTNSTGSDLRSMSDIDWLADEVEMIYFQVEGKFPGEMPSSMVMNVQTWQQQIAQFIGAVQKERALVTALFGIISIVAVFLVLAIFWTVVQQKTRDIGILRAVGASRVGIAWLFLRYGIILGVVGSILGVVLAIAIVWNINPIHEFIGTYFNIVIWDPKIYYFEEIPNRVEPVPALLVMAGGVIFATVGALIPALFAAFVDPVRALRYE